MKVKEEHYKHMEKKIKETLSQRNLISKEIIQDYNVKKIGKDYTKRAIWDICFASGLTSFICKELYSYCNDDHIFTALKRICV